jgi:hypothetical protein
MTYVYLGNSVSEVIGAGIKLTRFGERVELPDAIAKETARPGGLIAIPAEQFDEIGFTEAELANDWGAGGSKPEIQAKKVKALQILHEIRFPDVKTGDQIAGATGATGEEAK